MFASKQNLKLFAFSVGLPILIALAILVLYYLINLPKWTSCSSCGAGAGFVLVFGGFGICVIAMLATGVFSLILMTRQFYSLTIKEAVFWTVVTSIFPNYLIWELVLRQVFSIHWFSINTSFWLIFFVARGIRYFAKRA